MTNETLNWMAPTPRSYTWGANQPPMITVSAKDTEKVGDKVKTAYFRITANKKFMDKFYNSKTEFRIAIARTEKGILFDANPKKATPHFKFNKSRVINDRDLVMNLLDEFKKKLKEGEVVTFKLFSRPFGTHDDRPLSQFVENEP